MAAVMVAGICVAVAVVVFGVVYCGVAVASWAENFESGGEIDREVRDVG